MRKADKIGGFVAFGFLVVILGLMAWDTFWRMPRAEQKWEEHKKNHSFTLKSQVADVELEYKKLQHPDGHEEVLYLSVVLTGEHNIPYGQSGKHFVTDRLSVPFQVVHARFSVPMGKENLVILLSAVKDQSQVVLRGERHDDGTVTVDEVRKED